MPSPCFQFYPEEFVGSGTVGTADASEVACYVLLLCLDWTEGGFVYDEKRLARWCKVSPAAFRRAWSHLADKFPARDGRHFNTRLEKERLKQSEWREKSRKGAEAANAKRWGGGQGGGQGGDEMATGEASPNGRIPLPLPSPSPTPEVQLHTTTTLPAPRKPRASRTNGDELKGTSWLAPFQQVWERRNGAGTFPHGEAAKRLRPLLDAGWEVDEICDRLDWYLNNKGMEIVLDDQEEAEKRFFNPSITMFWKRFAFFDPKSSAPSKPPAWATELASAWTASGLGQVSVWRVTHELNNAYLSFFSMDDGVDYDAVLAKGRERGRVALKAAIDEHARLVPRGGWKEFLRNLPSYLERLGYGAAPAAEAA